MISISISCEQSELPALQAALAAVFATEGKPAPEDTVEENTKSQKKTNLTDAQKAEIVDRHKKGESTREIGLTMQIDARRVHGYIVSQTVFKKAPNSPVDEGKAQEVESPASKPEPKAMSRSELDRKIWDMHWDGMSAAEISESLYKEGLYYSEKSVQVRLKAQGAE